MQEYKRLIELIRCCNDELIMATDYELADYLLENGVIVPPCKVGDMVYGIGYDFVPKEDAEIRLLCKYECIGFNISSLGNNVNLIDEKNKLFQPSFYDFGKTVFLTKEEAEKALSKLQSS